ncbi:MAG TPA: hypothetical protein VF341_01980 [Anaeromyxobacteraceae bacterium]
MAAFIGFEAGGAIVPHFDHGGGSGFPQFSVDLFIGLGVTALMVGLALLVPICTSWVFLRRINAGAASLWGFVVGVLLAPLISAAMFGVGEICDHPNSPCRGFDTTTFGISLSVIYLAAPIMLAWVLTRVRQAQAGTVATQV